MKIVALILISIILVALLIRQVSIRSKRRLRKGELAHYIYLICDPNGCGRAVEMYENCVHISEHYKINLKEVGFDGSKLELWLKTIKSVELARARSDEVKPNEPIVIDTMGN